MNEIDDVRSLAGLSPTDDRIQEYIYGQCEVCKRRWTDCPTPDFAGGGVRGCEDFKRKKSY